MRASKHCCYVSLSARPQDGCTALVLALTKCADVSRQQSVVSALLNAGANPLARHPNGKAIRDLARSCSPTVQALVESVCARAVVFASVSSLSTSAGDFRLPGFLWPGCLGGRNQPMVCYIWAVVQGPEKPSSTYQTPISEGRLSLICFDLGGLLALVYLYSCDWMP